MVWSVLASSTSTTIDDAAVELGDRPRQGGLGVVSGQDYGDPAIIEHSGTIVPKNVA
jgi:hypothetical protein